MIPWGIDAPEASGRPSPRRQQYDVGYDLPHFPGQGKLVGFAELRAVANYSVIRAAMNIRIRELCGLEWDIVPTKDAHEQMRSDKGALDDFNTRKQQAMKFWKRPDPEYDSYQSWLAAGLDDLITYDAWALHLCPTRMPGKGPFGSDLAALELIDGTTIYPLVNIKGGTPRPPAVAFQQYLHGAPRVDLTTVQLESDQDRFTELGLPDEEYSGDQLMYARYYRRSNTMYGFSPLEQAITPIKTGMKRQEWALDFFTEGSVPGLIVICPAQYSPTQVRQLQDVLNMAGGDVGQKWKIRCLPGGETKVEQMKPAELANAADSQIIEQVLMILDVKPLEVGILAGGKTHGMGGAGMHEQGQASTKRTATRPLASWIEAQHDLIIQECWGQQDMCFRYAGLDEEDDNYQKAQTDQIYVSVGGFTLNDLRKNLDMEPYSVPEADEPIIITQTGIQTLSQALQAGQIDLQSKQLGLQSQQQLIDHPELRVAAAQQGPPGAKGGAKPAPPGGNKGGDAPPQSPPKTEVKSGTPASKAAEPDDGPGDEGWEADCLAELSAYRRFRTRSHPRPFEFAHLAKSVGADGVDLVEVEWAIKATAAKRRYVQDAVKRVGGQVQDHVDDLQGGEIEAGSFVDRSHQTMHAAFTRAYRSGARSVADGYQLTAEDRKLIEQLGNQQRTYLAGFADAVLRGAPDKDWAFRSQLYGSAVSSVWEQGRAAGKLTAYGDPVAAGEHEVWVTWHARIDACEECAGMDGESYPLDDVVEWPGQVHPHCHCYFTYRKVRVRQSAAEDEPQDIVAAAAPDAPAADQGPVVIPPGHQAGIEVPEGGSCCANCRYHVAAGNRCENPDFQLWHGSDAIPNPPERYCCDWWEG